jgi:hypothetical protein
MIGIALDVDDLGPLALSDIAAAVEMTPQAAEQ